MTNTSIFESWLTNAKEWIRVIDNGAILSRVYTNPAIVNQVKKHSFAKILDVGCGEGWLTRALSDQATEVVGIDAIDTLIENARQKGPQYFYTLTYEEIINGTTIPKSPYDGIILNFSLYQKEEVQDLLNALKRILTPNGKIIIQTLHPYFLKHQKTTYSSQWIEDSWKGLPGTFKDPHAWYARTLEDWIEVFNNCSLSIEDINEVTNDQDTLLSIIFTLHYVKNTTI